MKLRLLLDRVNDFFKTYFQRIIKDEGEVPGATFARALINPVTGEPVLFANNSGLLAGSAAPFLVPTGTILDYGGVAAPTGYLLCYGQAVSRATYAALFAAIGTVGGVGDGSTTFNIPDLRGRVVAGQDDMGGTSADRLTNQAGGVNGDTLGATGGEETHALSTAGGPALNVQTATVDNNLDLSTVSVVASVGYLEAGSPHNNVQPTIILNRIIKI